MTSTNNKSTKQSEIVECGMTKSDSLSTLQLSLRHVTVDLLAGSITLTLGNPPFTITILMMAIPLANLGLLSEVVDFFSNSRSFGDLMSWTLTRLPQGSWSDSSSLTVVVRQD